MCELSEERIIDAESTDFQKLTAAREEILKRGLVDHPDAISVVPIGDGHYALIIV